VLVVSHVVSWVLDVGGRHAAPQWRSAAIIESNTGHSEIEKFDTTMLLSDHRRASQPCTFLANNEIVFTLSVMRYHYQ
jgi:hypothetical protein